MPVISSAFVPSVTVTKSGRSATAEVSLKVKDHQIKRELSGFDGMERAFAMLPKVKNGQVSWQRYELGYKGQAIAGYYDRSVVDVHSLKVSRADAKAIAQYGAAFGVETNQGVVWAQSGDRNTKPTR